MSKKSSGKRHLYKVDDIERLPRISDLPRWGGHEIAMSGGSTGPSESWSNFLTEDRPVLSDAFGVLAQHDEDELLAVARAVGVLRET